MSDGTLELVVERVSLASLSPHPANPRVGNVSIIADSLRRHGQYRPVIAQRSTGYVIAGNHTWQAARRLGWSEIDAVLLDVDERQAKQILLVDNRASDLAVYDDGALEAVLLELKASGLGLAGTGYDESFLSSIEARLHPIETILPKQEVSADGVISAFHCVVHFASEDDTRAFFAMIGQERSRAIWWPATNGPTLPSSILGLRNTDGDD